MTERNWAGTYAYRAKALHRPSTVEQLQEIVAAAPQLRVLGSRHSFTAIADAAELVSLEALASDIRVDRGAGTVSFAAGLRYGDIAEALDREGLALQNLASLPHISVGGAVATATHGSGDTAGNLATAVAGLDLVTSDGELVTTARGEPDFDGMVVNLGALGVVVRLTLDVEPTYAVRQRVFDGLAWDALYDNFDLVTSAGDSVSVFTRFGTAIDHVLVKSRVEDEAERVRTDLFGAPPAESERHPIAGMDPRNATAQLGVPGPWWDRLPHFRMGFTPSAGEEIQSEYLLPRRHAIDAITAVRGLADAIRPALMVAEIRTVAADRLWMSPQHGRDTVGIHFTWRRDAAVVHRVVADVEAALAPYDARPHWGKLFLLDAEQVAPQYERLGDFRRLAARLDPGGAFRNTWLERHVLGSS